MRYAVRNITNRKYKIVKFESIDIHFALEHLQVIVKSFLPYKGLVTEHLFQRTK